MSSKQKDKGNRFEYETRDKFIDKNIRCKRAYASDGRSLGLTEDVDLLATYKHKDYKIQCKVRKKLSELYIPKDTVDIQVLKQDYGVAFAVVKLDMLIDLISKQRDSNKLIDNI